MTTPHYLRLCETSVVVKDRHLRVVGEWQSGCVCCCAEVTASSLPGSDGKLTMPLCPRHVRWAMACRRERVGKQARNLKKLLFAWCRYQGDDREAAKVWLGY
jgi:hypothetical protein